MTKLPDMLYVRHPTTGKTIIIKAYEKGYYECGPGYRDQDPMILNRNFGLPMDEKTAEVMLAGSMFGWNIPMVRDYVGGTQRSFSVRARPNQKRTIRPRRR